MLSRCIDAPRQRVFHVWTQRLPEWWGPYGMTVPICEIELRAGGVFRTVMRAPDGAEYATRGVFLDVVPPERIAFTDAFDPGWVPAPGVFFTGIVTFEALGAGTLYTARARHWTAANCRRHAEMGFYQGWSESLERLVALVMAG